MLIVFFYLVGVAFVQFIPATATIAIMFAFMETMDDSGEITPSRLLLPLLGVMQIWKGFIPLGIGATTFASVNAKYEGIIQNENLMLKMLDPFKVTALPIIVLTVYCLFAWRLMPRTTQTDKSALKEVKDQKPLDPVKEKIIYAVFIGVMACLVLNKFTGSFMYLAPAVGVLILLYTGAFPIQDAVKAMTADMIWMLAGVLMMASALGSSGAGELIGSAIISLLGEHPSSFMITLTFTAVTVIMTSFISNAGCSNVLIPIAASIALAGNMDPRGLILAITIGCRLAIGFPSGSGEGAVTYAAGGYNPAKVAKFTIPYIILAIISLSVSCNYFFPVYG
jgi:sodium-dependent dicarboxylate transporter 2/3/5